MDNQACVREIFVFCSSCGDANDGRPGSPSWCTCDDRTPRESIRRNEWGYLAPIRQKRYEANPWVIKQWRKRALSFLRNSRHVFYMDAHLIEGHVLQVILSTDDVQLNQTVLPWSVILGRPVGVNVFRGVVYDVDTDTERILQRAKIQFSPKRIIRFVLDQCEGVPALVISDVKSLVEKHCLVTFLKQIIYKYFIPGSQLCSMAHCERYAAAVKVTSSHLGQTKMYCADHARMLGYGDILLYNPLIVSLTPHRHNVVLAAMNIEEVYGSRRGDRDGDVVPVSGQPTVMSNTWTVLTKLPQMQPLVSENPLDKLRETAKHLLHHDEDHPQTGIGVDLQHDLTRRLLRRVVHEEYPKISPLVIPLTEEDFPHGWVET